MKNSKIIISLLLGSYLILLTHLSLPIFNDIFLSESEKHSHTGTVFCSEIHNHSSKKHTEDDFHNNEHHCVYCCGHNKFLEFTNNSKTFSPEKVTQVMGIITEYNVFEEVELSGTNQLYLQNVFKFPILDHIVSSNQFRAPPLV